jgi:Fe-Mn family superoxide dismutase
MSKKTVGGGMTRRSFLIGAAGGCAMLGTGMLGLHGCSSSKPAAEGLTLPPLPYKENALEPHISKLTISYHYGKHHKAYVDNTNELIKGSDLAALPLDQIVKQTYGASDKTPIFNNAAQAWNHDFYWKSLDPKGGKPEGEIAQRIAASFGSYDGFKKEFLKAGTTLFGSGWAWLVLDGNEIKIVSTSNADTPIAHGQTPLLVIDDCEHAYYLDYQNRRKDYLNAVIENLLNWKFAASNLPAA